MAAKFPDDSKYVFRFSDLPAEPQRILPRIEGYENMPLVSLEEAVNPLTSLVANVEQMTQTAKQYHLKSEYGLTCDESAAISLYTMEWPPQEKSFFAILNDTLRTADRNLLKPWFLYLRLIITSLAKVPSNSPHLTVYRGVKMDLSAQYPKGSTVTWWGFSSCTTLVTMLSDERFMGRTGTRTLFIIESHSAKNIKPYSFYPEEHEVLLPPARQFQVIDCLDQGNGLHLIQLKEIEPMFPLIDIVPQPMTVSSKSLQQSVSLTPTEQVLKTLIPPNCGNRNLQKHIDAMYSDPVIVLAKTTSSLEQR
jgi:hypothetical protein